jgi:hypothetical protein
MLYTEWKWSKRPGKSGFRTPCGKKIGVYSWFVKRGSQSALARWKTENLPDEFKPHQWFMIMVFDNLSNQAENSPKSNERLRRAQDRHYLMGRGRRY